MRLTDVCQIRKNSVNVGDPRPCEFGHTGGGTPDLEAGRQFYVEQARVIVGPDTALAALTSVAGWEVIHKGKTYRFSAVLPRYRPGGRLHHVSIDLEQLTG